MLPKIIPKLEKHGELELKPEVRKKLFKISRSTIDRLLAPERERLNLKSRAKTKPGSLLKRQIPIRSHAGWKENEPGFVEADLVGHDGGLAKGDFAWSLTLVDVFTQWTEIEPLRNRAQVWAFSALNEAKERFPFPLKGIDCDNDSAFINHHLFRWCQERGSFLPVQGLTGKTITVMWNRRTGQWLGDILAIFAMTRRRRFRCLKSLAGF